MNNKDLEEYLEHREEFEEAVNKIINDPNALSNLDSKSLKIIFSALRAIQIKIPNSDRYKIMDLYNKIAKRMAILLKENEIYGKININNNILLKYLTKDLNRKVLYSKSEITLPKNPLLIDEPIIEDSYNDINEYDGIIIGDKVRSIKNSFNSSTIESIFFGYFNSKDIDDSKLLIKDSFNNSSLKKLFVTEKIYEIKGSFNNCKNLEEFIFGRSKKNRPPEITYINNSLNGVSNLNNVEIDNAFTMLSIDNSFFKANLTSNKNQGIEEYDLEIINNQTRKKFKITFDHENKKIYCNKYGNFLDLIMAMYHIYNESKLDYIWIEPYLKGQLYEDYQIEYGKKKNSEGQDSFQHRKRQ